MIQVVIDKVLAEACPSILELEPTLGNFDPGATIEVRWGNSTQEQVAINRHKNRKFKLHVPDLQTSERAVATLEVPLTLDKTLVGNAKVALINKKNYNWRAFTRDMGTVVSRNIVLKMAADEIRNGNKPKLAYVAKDVLLDGVAPTSVDVLLRLRNLRGY